ncbi:MAG: AAA family ATPase [Proteobacteria bacterium]|nr:AAA family ATPase [Pseudomonadota bacterium]
MPELDTISIRGFKSIAAIDDLKLGAINVLIGPNGAGKSNFLAVFALVRAVREQRLRDYVARAGGASRILHLGPKVTDAVRVRLLFGRPETSYEIELTPTDTDELRPDREIIRSGKGGGLSISPGSVRPEPWVGSLLRHQAGVDLRHGLDSWQTYHFHDTSPNAPMKVAAAIHDNGYLRPDGANLPAFLYLLRETHPAAYALIRSTVQLVAPFFDDFVLEPQRLNPDMIRLEWRHRNTDAYFDVSSLSDGTLRFIALATLFLQPETLRPSLILVDEPELGLHPYAITLLASLIRQASTATQVILATQSPVFLDHFTPEEVLVADLIDGRTQFTRLDPDHLADWLKDYSLGQLWEKNELGGRPGGA